MYDLDAHTIYEKMYPFVDEALIWTLSNVEWRDSYQLEIELDFEKMLREHPYEINFTFTPKLYNECMSLIMDMQFKGKVNPFPLDAVGRYERSKCSIFFSDKEDAIMFRLKLDSTKLCNLGALPS